MSVTAFPYRKHVEEVQREQEEKQLRKKRSLEEFEECIDAALEKRRAANMTLEIWSKILRLMTAANRREKSEDESWLCYFKSIAEIEDLDCPPQLLHKDLSFEDALLQTSGVITKFRKQVATAEAEAQRATNRKNKREQHEAKLESRQRKKVETLLEKPEVVEVKKATKKHLVLNVLTD